MVQVRLLPTPAQASALAETLHACNLAAEHVSHVGFTQQVTSGQALQRLVYSEVKAQFGLSAQPALHVIRKVADAYTTLRANIRAGNLGKDGCARRRRAESKPVGFRPDAAQPFDDRCLSWWHDEGTVSIWTVGGRLKGVRFVGNPDQLKILQQYRQGESDLIRRDGMWLLIATCDVPEEPLFEPTRLRKPQRVALHSWAFAQLGAFISYKATRAGVPVVQIDPRNTSQTCSECRYLDKRNRLSQAVFACRACGHTANADLNASRNISRLAEAVWNAGRQSSAPTAAQSATVGRGRSRQVVVPEPQARPFRAEKLTEYGTH